MKEDHERQLKEICKKLPEIMSRPTDVPAKHYKMWCCKNWLIKAAKEMPRLKGRFTGYASDPRTDFEDYERLKGIGLSEIHLPETYYNEEHKVLIQRKIDGRILQKGNQQDESEFARFKEEYDAKKKETGLPYNRMRIQIRNLKVDDKGRHWLIDFD